MTPEFGQTTGVGCHSMSTVRIERYAMPLECEFLPRCGLFKKHRQTESLACDWLMNQYCSGPTSSGCRRKQHYLKHRVPPPDDMLPSGTMMATDRGQQGADPERGNAGPIATTSWHPTP
jgi:hypothetical protein